MTLTIKIDDATEKRLVSEASQSGKSLEDYVADILRNTPVSDPLNQARKPNLGFAANWEIRISEDFDEPLEDFAEYT